MNEAEKKTPLFEQHKELGGRIVDYAGFMLPVQYKDLIEEHMAVRQNAGLFDVSHMGEILVSGEDALDNLNYIFSNDFTSMRDGAVRYSPMCNERGGIVDDMLIYRFSQDRYMVVPNAANREKVAGVMKERLKGNVRMEDRSDDFAQISMITTD